MSAELCVCVKERSEVGSEVMHKCSGAVDRALHAEGWKELPWRTREDGSKYRGKAAVLLLLLFETGLVWPPLSLIPDPLASASQVCATVVG